MVAADLPCVRCGRKPAGWCGKKLSENEAECRQTALCLDCRAAWHDYNRSKSFLVYDRTHGRPAEIFWMAIFERFVKRLPPLNQVESEKLLNECRKQAKAKK